MRSAEFFFFGSFIDGTELKIIKATPKRRFTISFKNRPFKKPSEFDHPFQDSSLEMEF